MFFWKYVFIIIDRRTAQKRSNRCTVIHSYSPTIRFNCRKDWQDASRLDVSNCQCRPHNNIDSNLSIKHHISNNVSTCFVIIFIRVIRLFVGRCGVVGSTLAFGSIGHGLWARIWAPLIFTSWCISLQQAEITGEVHTERFSSSTAVVHSASYPPGRANRVAAYQW